MIFIWHPQTIIEHRNFISLWFLAAGLRLRDWPVLAFQHEFMVRMSIMLSQTGHTLLQILRIDYRADLVHVQGTSNLMTEENEFPSIEIFENLLNNSSLITYFSLILVYNGINQARVIDYQTDEKERSRNSSDFSCILWPMRTKHLVGFNIFFPQKCLNGFSKNFILLLFVY